MMANYLLALVAALSILLVVAAFVWVWNAYKKESEDNKQMERDRRNREATMDGNRAFPEKPTETATPEYIRGTWKK